MLKFTSRSLFLVLVITLAGGWSWFLTEEQKEECELRASLQSTDFSAKKAYERCTQTIRQEYKDRKEAKLQQEIQEEKDRLQREKWAKEWEEEKKRKNREAIRRKQLIQIKAGAIKENCFGMIKELEKQQEIAGYRWFYPSAIDEEKARYLYKRLMDSEKGYSSQWLRNDLMMAVRVAMGELCDVERGTLILHDKEVPNHYEFLAEEYLKFK